jgi:CRISPR system Cascade subunit CasD
MGVRVDDPGTILKELQIAGHEGGVIRSNGKLSDDGVKSDRYYLVNASFLVGLEGPEVLLKECLAAIREPVYAPCLGRKGCCPSQYLDLPDGGIRSCTLEKALTNEPVSSKSKDELLFVTETEAGNSTDRLRDVCLDFANRTFSSRFVRHWHAIPPQESTRR